MLNHRNHSAVLKHAGRLAKRIHRVLATGLLLLWFAVGTASWAEAAIPGTLIVNQVKVASDTNTRYATATTKIIERTRSTLDFLVYAPGAPGSVSLQVETTLYSTDGTAAGSFAPAPPPHMVGASAPLPVGQPLPLQHTGFLHAGNPLFLSLTDLDQNLYPTLRETVLVRVSAPNGDTEILQLVETTADSGVFTGYLNTGEASASHASGDGWLAITSGDTIEGLYTDPVDGSDSAASAALVDPLGRVFDSSSGALLDGAAITLLNADGSLATVWGDDGVSSYPATIISGGVATDASGKEYRFAKGEYRFPFIAPGRYTLRVEPPSGYGAPSSVSFAQLQALPGAPFAIVDGSKGEPFDVGAEPVVYIDIPLDPTDGLWLQKTASQDAVSIGDFLQYQLKLENSSETAAFNNLTIVDQLPLGFRYQKGSTRSNGQTLVDPSQSDNGRTLTFQFGDLPAASARTISYVVEIAAGSQTGPAVNRAQALDPLGNASNTATYKVTVQEAFFRNDTFLVGRVINGSCSEPEATKTGLAGARIYLEDGTFVDSDAEGKFHFEGVDPGLHVVQLDLASLPAGYEAIPCEQSSQFAGRTFSQFVDLQGGTLWRTDFYVQPLPAVSGEVAMAMSGTLTGSRIDYRLDLSTVTVPASNLVLNVMLPAQAHFTTGSALLDGQGQPPAESRDGTISFQLGSRPADWSGRLTFQAELDTALAAGELSSKAVLLFDTPTAKGQQTPLAEVLHRVDEQTRTKRDEFNLYPSFPSFVATLQDNDLRMLDQTINSLEGQDIVRVTVIGHTDNVPIAKGNRHIFADNQALSLARAENVGRYLATRMHIPEERLIIRGMGETLPVADNRTEAGRARNRRVDLVIETEQSERTVQLATVRGDSGPKVAATASQAGGAAATPAAEPQTLAAQAPSAGIFKPTDGSLIPDALAQVSFRIDSQLTAKLLVDGQEISSKNLGTRFKEGALTTYSYIGVDLGKPGPHVLQVQGVDPFGNARFEQVIGVVRTDRIEAIRLVSSDGNLADGRTPVTLKLQLLDAAGNVIPAESRLEVRGSKLVPLGDGHTKPGQELDRTADRSVKVSADGIVQFQPVNQSGAYPVVLAYNDAELETSVYIKPKMRDWILVGFAEGTLGYDTFSGNEVSLEEAGIDEHFYDDGQVKFFAKGAVKGEWLMTMAYDSDKPNRDGDSLYQMIDPNTYYPLYGDGSRQEYEASSAHKIYIKLERDQFYALFGDMNTGLSQTTLTRYNRSMSGFKSELQDEHFSYTMFAAETKQAFVQDELRGDGTSGIYYLSQKNLVINSESVTIETRDRFRSEIIHDTRTLQRYSDYDIDYDHGSLTFKRPVPSKDENFDPVFIVVRYETMDSGNANLNYGGRAAVKVLDQKVELGASFVHEETGDGQGDLYGVDTTVKLTPQTSVHLEAARTDNQFYDDHDNDNAYLAEINHDANRLKTRAYFLEQGEEFGLGQQNSSESGTRKYGTEALYHFTPKFSMAALAYHEDVMANDNKRNVGELDARYQAERYGLNGGFRYAEDRLGDGRTMRSEQLLAGGNWLSADTKLKLRADHEQSLKGMNKNVDYPTRTVTGLDYQISRRISAFAEQEFTWGEDQDTQGTRAGFKANPWQGGEVRTTVEQQLAENSQRVFAIFGLDQSWRVTENWSVDTALDRSYTVKSSQDYQFNDNVPTAQGGNDDFTSVSIGSTYRQAKWTWWNRLETRQADSEDKYGASTSVVVEPRQGIALSAKALAFIADASGGTRSKNGNIRMGLAYRPTASRWILLNRLDFYFDRQDHSPADYDNWRIVNNLHANFRLSSKVQMSFYYGLKYVRDSFQGSSYSGYTDLIAYEMRYNITKRWDIGVHGSVLHSWNSNNLAYSAGGDIGYSPMANTWISLGYNVFGFEDDDFSAANYTAQGPYLRFRAKFDQQSVRDAAAWINN